MNKLSYENQGNSTYLVYVQQPEDQLDTMSLGMLTNNKIPGLAPTQFSQVDTTKYIKYNVSAKISASQLFTGTINRKRLVGVFSGIVDAMLSAEEYMIETSSILLDLEYIFADVSTGDTILICLPILNRDAQNVDLGSFFKRIMFSTQFDQTENCDYVAKIINYLNSAPIFSLTDFKGVLEGLKKNAAGVNPMQAAPTPPIGQPQPQMAPPVQQPMQQPMQPQMPQMPQMPPQQQRVPQQPMQQYRTQNPQQMPMPGGKAGQQMPQPPRTNVPAAGAPQNLPPQSTEPENKISLFYLLQHYNKENAEAYKAQKEAAKAAKKGGAAPAAAPAAGPVPGGMPAAPAAQPPQKGKKKKNAGTPVGFAVPGQQPNFAVPGQQPNFAVPGQKAGQQPNFAVPGQQPNFAAPGQKAGQQPNFAVPGQQPNFAVPGQPAAQVKTGPAQQPVVQPQGFQPQAAQPRQTVPQPRQPVPQPQPPISQPSVPYAQQAAPTQSQPVNFGETTVLGGGTLGETTVLGAAMQEQAVKPYLIRMKNNEKISVDKPVFRIGKERSYVDYFVGDNPAISRSHANIIARDGVYFILDTNSTNHTYVNGGMIQSNSEVKISHGTKIRLANEEFEFRLY